MSTPTYSFTLPAPPDQPPARPARRRVANKALWLVGVGLLANAAVMLYAQITGHAPDIVLDRAAFAQAAPAPGAMLGARGIYMMPAQLSPNTYGVYLMDIDSGTICVYRTNPDNLHLRLMAARSFQYDRFLEDFNNDPLLPKEVQKIVQGNRQRMELKQKEAEPTVDQNPKPDPNLPDVPATVPN